MKSFLVEYQVSRRKRTRMYSRVVEAATAFAARKSVARVGVKVLKTTRVA